jgi:hypothetical protein
MLREVEKASVGGRPARTSYEITAKGSDEFESLLRELWWNVKPATDPFDAAFSFLPALPREEAVAALRNRGRLLAAIVESLRASIASAWIKDSKPTHVTWLFELGIARMEGEIGWCERIADLVESGVSYLPDTLRSSPEFRAAFDGSADPPVEQ